MREIFERRTPSISSSVFPSWGQATFSCSRRVAELEKRVKLLDDRLAKVEKYVRAQASSISAFGASLESAVKKGYTAGINYESRQVLVGGWRKIVEAAAKNAPSQAKPTKGKAKPSRGGRSR